MYRHLCVEDSYRESKSQLESKGEIKNDPRLGGLAEPDEVRVSTS
jgi:hypothetical protein